MVCLCLLDIQVHATHSVYTPVGTMRLGGHFLTYDTLHLMHNAHMYNDSELPEHLQSVGAKMHCDLSTNESQLIDKSCEWHWYFLLLSMQKVGVSHVSAPRY